MLSLACAQPDLVAQEEVIEDQMRSLRIPRVSRPPTLDDYLNGVPREAELTVTDFRQYRPGDGEPVSQPTTAFLSYDDKNLYVAFICKDSPKLIRARLSKHDQTMADDRTMVNLDTFHDRQRMYWFNVNPYGVQADGTLTDGQPVDVNWNTLWQSDASFTEDGYVTLAVIPFKSIRFSSDKEQRWGLILGRFIMRGNEWALWPYVSNRRPGLAQQGGDLEGLEDISSGRNIQLIPYGFFARSRYLDTPPGSAARFQTENETRVGLDAKIVLRDAFTLDLALNPDFSQVESDEPQVTVNQRFEVFFPERRPFFLDNAGYFVTPVRLFFSRRIVDPSLGSRLTGKVGNWSLGALFADDRAPGKTVAAGDPHFEKHSPVGVFRLQREFRRGSRTHTLGALATFQEFGSAYNRVASMDTRLQVLRNWIFTGQAVTSNTRTVDGEELAGPAYYADWEHAGRHFVWRTTYRDFSPNFRADLGFIRRVDIRHTYQDIGYLWRPEGHAIQSIGPVVSWYSYHDRTGRTTDWNLSPELRITAVRGTSFAYEYESSYEYYGGIGFRQNAHESEFRTAWFRWLSVSGDLSIGDGINYRPAEGLSPFTGKAKQMGVTFTLRPGARLRLDETYIYSGLRTGGRSDLTGVADGTTVFTNHLVRSKVNYQFTRRLSLRFIFDYNSVLPNTRLVDLEKEKRVGLDALFTYMLNPGTALYAGYTDLYENYRLNPLLNPELERIPNPTLNTGRQFFVKLSYLFRF
jgi:uncharacterized protein DUF5916